MEIKDSQTTNFLPEMKVATEMQQKKSKIQTVLLSRASQDIPESVSSLYLSHLFQGRPDFLYWDVLAANSIS